MYYEASKIISAALKDATIGVNAMITSLSLPAGVSRPPAVADIVDEGTDIEVANMLGPQNTPALYVMLDDMIQMAPEDPNQVKQQIIDLPIAIRYMTRNVDSVTLRQEAMLTLRAVIKTLIRLDRNENADKRDLNGIFLIAMTNLTALDIRESVGDAMAVGAVVVTYQAENTDP